MTIEKVKYDLHKITPEGTTRDLVGNLIPSTDLQPRMVLNPSPVGPVRISETRYADKLQEAKDLGYGGR